ncbi:MAG: EMC3/TMCO1 family protein [Candidatus Bathyarchaeota archaeon]|nr:EMC3/TMCO1 family protein [Candidatus Bathyarchaeota archaeon]
MFEEFIEWTKSFLSLFLQMPNSAIFVFSVSLALNLAMMAAYRLMVDIDQLRENDMKVRKYMRDLKDAEKRGDRRSLKKLRRIESRINKLQNLNAKQRSKVSLLFMVPLMAIYLLLSATFSGLNVVKLPFAFPLVGSDELPFAWWYLICHFTLYTMFSRIFGLTYEVE